MVAMLLMVGLQAQAVDTVDLNTNEVPTVILLDSDFEESPTSGNDASTLLNSSRDVFNTIAAYNLGSLRYRVRGNDSKYSEVMINGISMNDPETGRPVFSNWGGLNDAFRNSVVPSEIFASLRRKRVDKSASDCHRRGKIACGRV